MAMLALLRKSCFNFWLWNEQKKMRAAKEEERAQMALKITNPYHTPVTP